MEIRTPAVSGTFYPENEKKLKNLIHDCFMHPIGPGKTFPIESNEKIPLPHEVRQWSVGKIFDCADKWELRFSEVFQILVDNLGKELLKEAIRIQQVRDIFGIRAVDEIRSELNIS